jgi:methyl-accepting chemotaxis protein
MPRLAARVMAIGLGTIVLGIVIAPQVLRVGPVGGAGAAIVCALAVIGAFSLVRRAIATSRLDDHARESSLGQRQRDEQVTSFLDGHARLDRAVAAQLNVVIDDSESAAIALVRRVAALDKNAVTQVQELVRSEAARTALEDKIVGGGGAICEIEKFVQDLPATIRADIQGIHGAALHEIEGLHAFVGLIKRLSTQTSMLALNAEIAAFAAGDHGRVFVVVASEVRALSHRSAETAALIDAGLVKARQTMQHSLESSTMTQHISGAAKLVQSIHVLQQTHEQIRAVNASTLARVTQDSADLAREIGEMLGQVQTQDVVRQRLERVAGALVGRTETFAQLVRAITDPAADLSPAIAQLSNMVEGYVATEERHQKASVRSSLPSIELF